MATTDERADHRIELSKHKIDAFRVDQDQGRDVWHDTKVAGLGVRVSWTGRKVWQVIYRVAGDRTKRRLDIGTYPALTLADARDRARAIINEANAGNDPADKKRERKKAPTWEKLAEEYIELYAKKRKRTWKSDENILQKDIVPAWRNKKPQDIKRKHVIDLLDDIAARAPIQANRTLALLRKIYNWAISRDIVEVNPCLMVQAPSQENERDRVLAEKEVKAVWVSCDRVGRAWGDAIKLMLITAQRRGEVMAMRWGDVDLEAGWWTIPAEEAKNALAHRVPLTAPALAILKDRQELAGGSEKCKGEAWVFESPKQREGRPTAHISNPNRTVNNIRDHVAELLKIKVDQVDFRLHDLRRTAASYMGSMGIARLVISKVLNHVETGITRVYDRHTYDAEKREALDAWAERLMSIVASAA